MNIESYLSKFALKGEVISVETFGNGHINQTFLVKTTEETEGQDSRSVRPMGKVQAPFRNPTQPR